MYKWMFRLSVVILLTVSGFSIAHSESITEFLGPTPQETEHYSESFKEEAIQLQETDTETINSGQPLLQLPILSDVHIGRDSEGGVEKPETRYQNALLDLQEIAPNMDAFIMVGDMTDLGRESQYNLFNRLTNQYVGQDVEKIYTIGNHEFFEGRVLPKTGATDEDVRGRFTEKTGNSKVYYDRWLKGYHFIVLGSEASSNGNPNYNDIEAFMSDEQINWFKRTIAEQAEAHKPIFVFLHQPLNGTVTGSDEWGAGEISTKLKEILKDYPQTIIFSGHTHYSLADSKSVVQSEFTSVNTGSVAYIEGQKQLSQGLLVNVYKDKVEIKAREFTTKQWIKSTEISF